MIHANIISNFLPCKLTSVRTNETFDSILEEALLIMTIFNQFYSHYGKCSNIQILRIVFFKVIQILSDMDLIDPLPGEKAL